MDRVTRTVLRSSHPFRTGDCPSHVRPHFIEAAVRVGQTFLSAHVNVFLSIEADGEAARPTMPPRIWAGEGVRCTSTREDGRFFAALRMTCFAIAISEMFRSYVCQFRHPLGPCRSLNLRFLEPFPKPVEGPAKGGLNAVISTSRFDKLNAGNDHAFVGNLGFRS